jgi:predicted N-acetyltransferase YhbS
MSIEIVRIDESATPGKAFLLPGSFSPYTIGHHEVARQAAAHAARTGHTHFYHGIGAAEKRTEGDPLSHAQKRSVIRAAHKRLSREHKSLKFHATGASHGNPFRQLAHLAQKGHKHITVGLGSDQMKGKLRREIETNIAKKGGIEDKTGKVHKVKVEFHQLGAERQEQDMPRHEVLGKLRKGDVSVAKAGRLRKAVASGDTELAHALMPKHMNKPKYFGMIKQAQSKVPVKKVRKKKLAEGLMSFADFISEAPELDAYIDPPSGKKEKFGPEYLRKKERTYHLHSGYKFVKHENLGEIHPGYELHRHVSSFEHAQHPNKKVHSHQYSIVHKKSGDVAGEIDASAGKISRKTGEYKRGTGKGLKIDWVHVQPEHSSKKVGTSLAVAAYKHLHKLGHSIKSDTRQSFGGAHVWDTLRKDKDVKHHVRFHDEKDNKAEPAHKLDYGAIWQEHPSAQETTLVLHAKPKKKVVTEDIELIPVDRSKNPSKPRKAEDVHKGYSTKDYSSEKIVTKKNLGEIHPGYDLHHHARIAKDHRGRDVLRHQFTIVHKASGDIAGEMNAKGGKLHPTKGVVLGPKGKGLKVTHLEVHPDHSSKKVGKSLAVEMYRHLHRRGHAIQSDAIQSHGAAHVWNTMRNDPELKKHMMIHSDREPLRGERHTFEKRAHRRPERHIWYQHSRNWSAGREKVEGSHGDEPDEVKTLVLAGKKRRKKVTEDIEMANILSKPHGGYHRDFTRMIEGRGEKPKRSGRIAKGYTLHTSTDKDDQKIQTHYIVHDATNHVAGEVTTRSHDDRHEVINTNIHGDHTKKKIGKSLAVLAYKHLARKKGNLHSSSLQSPGGASIWNRMRKDPKMKGKVFHQTQGGEVPAHDVPDKHIWAAEVKVDRSKKTPEYLPGSQRHGDAWRKVLASRLVIRPTKKS